MEQHLEPLLVHLASLPESDRIDAINTIRSALHGVSPMASHPVDCVLWLRMENVVANDYNPNTVAAPEMKLLQRSIEADGYTQPIVAMQTGESVEVVDGFHRNRVGRECDSVAATLHGRLPVALIRASQADRPDRIAATIRHNRARGKHRVDAMSDIVLELSRRNWTDSKIAKELGMEDDEVLRLKQIQGLAEMFADRDFSEAWEIK